MSKSLMVSASLLTAMALSALPVQAAEAKAEAHFIYLDPKPLDPAVSLPPPPAAGSPDEAFQIADVRAFIASRTPEQIAKAAKDDKTESVMFLADVLPGLDLNKLPATRKLFDEVRNDEKLEAKTYKHYFHRTRPYLVDPSIKTCVAIDPGDAQQSYPSGHSVMGSSMGLIMAHLIPEKANLIEARVGLYLENRVACGMHFHSDVAAGETLGTAIGEQLLQNADFMKDFDAAKVELKAAGLTQ